MCTWHTNVNVYANLKGQLKFEFKKAREDNVNGGKRCFPATTNVWKL